jgi:hypothetical protein
LVGFESLLGSQKGYECLADTGAPLLEPELSDGGPWLCENYGGAAHYYPVMRQRRLHRRFLDLARKITLDGIRDFALRHGLTWIRDLLRAYPESVAARKVMDAQARWSMAR